MADIVAAIHGHLTTMAPHQRARLTAEQLKQAADEIERLRSLVRFQDGVIRSGDVACLTEAEREAIAWAVSAAEDCQHPADDTLRRLLARLEAAK